MSEVKQPNYSAHWANPSLVSKLKVIPAVRLCYNLYAAVEAMRRTGSGAIVNLASVMGSVGYPTFLPFSDGFNPYPQSKGAVAQMTHHMGVRLAAEEIRVNAVAPGFIYTAITENVTKTPQLHAMMKNLHPIKRMGQAEEVAFRALDEASYVIGVVWAVDGGYAAQ